METKKFTRLRAGKIKKVPFNKMLAEQTINKWGLSMTTIDIWRHRGTIPSDYLIDINQHILTLSQACKKQLAVMLKRNFNRTKLAAKMGLHKEVLTRYTGSKTGNSRKPVVYVAFKHTFDLYHTILKAKTFEEKKEVLRDVLLNQCFVLQRVTEHLEIHPQYVADFRDGYDRLSKEQIKRAYDGVLEIIKCGVTS